MKESFGSSVLFYIFLGFIAVFIVFIAIIIDYASAYRTNNFVVNYIEQYEGKFPYNDTSGNSLVGFLKKNKYYNGLTVTCENNENGSVFTVTTNIKFYIPLIGINVTLPIRNNSKTIFAIECKPDGNDLPSVGDSWKGE